MIDGLTVLAVVPARGGSKSIPRKNLKRSAAFRWSAARRRSPPPCPSSMRR
jgi:hypothetical protein